eukprot:TRINITY_DN4904_c0_g1_i2.p1 TRINITY_DN4904_c0_g1~~TRINITY_DN4904_c0_g1_i2.p1  ORF type:complete len:1018 (+),score=313.91 TRINITY_DN4904_c0_g1_i2:256-3054(+)
MSAAQRRTAAASARALAGLSHPFLLPCYGSFDDDGSINVLTEHPKGGDLAGLVMRSPAQPEERTVLGWFARIVLALEYVHKRGVVHGGLRTCNVFFTSKGQLQLGNFALCPSRQWAGSVQLPPLAAGEEYGQAAEVWCLGLLLWEVCSQRRAFGTDGQPTKAAADAARGSASPIPLWYSSELRACVAAMLASSASERPTMDDLIGGALLRGAMREIQAVGPACRVSDASLPLRPRPSLPTPAAAPASSLWRRPSSQSPPASSSLHGGLTQRAERCISPPQQRRPPARPAPSAPPPASPRAPRRVNGGVCSPTAAPAVDPSPKAGDPRSRNGWVDNAHSPPTPDQAPRAAQPAEVVNGGPPSCRGGQQTGRALQHPPSLRGLREKRQRMRQATPVGGGTATTQSAAEWLAGAQAQFGELTDMLAQMPAASHRSDAAQPDPLTPPPTHAGDRAPQRRRRASSAHRVRAAADARKPGPASLRCSEPAPVLARRPARAASPPASLRSDPAPERRRRPPSPVGCGAELTVAPAVAAAANRRQKQREAAKETQTKHRQSMRKVKPRVTRDMLLTHQWQQQRTDVVSPLADDGKCEVIIIPSANRHAGAEPPRRSDGSPPEAGPATPRGSRRRAQSPPPRASAQHSTPPHRASTGSGGQRGSSRLRTSSACAPLRGDANPASDRRVRQAERDCARESLRKARLQAQKAGRGDGWSFELCLTQHQQPGHSPSPPHEHDWSAGLLPDAPAPSRPPAPSAPPAPAAPPPSQHLLPASPPHALRFLSPAAPDDPEPDAAHGPAPERMGSGPAEGRVFGLPSPPSPPPLPAEVSLSPNGGKNRTPPDSGSDPDPPPAPQPPAAAIRAGGLDTMQERVASKIECLREALEGQLGEAAFREVYQLARGGSPSPSAALGVDDGRARAVDRMLIQLLDFEDLFYGGAE